MVAIWLLEGEPLMAVTAKGGVVCSVPLLDAWPTVFVGLQDFF